MKFKTGDKVRLVYNGGMSAKRGATATVVDTGLWLKVKWDDTLGTGLRCGQNDGRYDPESFELVPAPASFKVGDRVKTDCADLSTKHHDIVCIVDALPNGNGFMAEEYRLRPVGGKLNDGYQIDAFYLSEPYIRRADSVAVTFEVSEADARNVAKRGYLTWDAENAATAAVKAVGAKLPPETVTVTFTRDEAQRLVSIHGSYTPIGGKAKAALDG